ncbi:AAA family ATPase [Paenibacillus cymbidii]|uniref:AAA family ATPase n=1 Tax=Paenibacillus cymbidii TaxID=1639034 RepID=UPI001080F6C0|nr:hypothetical protein [Paenibacillus cymbidii]
METNHETGFGKLLVFAGSTPNVGTTLIAFGTAVLLAKATGKQVGYICLNLKSSKLHRYLGADEPFATLDQLRAALKSQSLGSRQLLQYCTRPKETNGLHVLFGSMLREQAEFYRPEDIEHLLEVARCCLDLCVVDVSAYWDNAATVCSMRAADARMLVTSGEITHFQEDIDRGLKPIVSMLGLPLGSFELIVNQLEPPAYAGGFKPGDIGKECGMRVVAGISRCPEAVRLLNHGSAMALYDARHPFRAQLQPAVDRLMERCGLTKREAPRAQLWLRRLIGAGASS